MVLLCTQNQPHLCLLWTSPQGWQQSLHRNKHGGKLVIVPMRAWQQQTVSVSTHIWTIPAISSQKFGAAICSSQIWRSGRMVLESPAGCTTHYAQATAETGINTITSVLGRARLSLRTGEWWETVPQKLEMQSQLCQQSKGVPSHFLESASEDESQSTEDTWGTCSLVLILAWMSANITPVSVRVALT